MLGVVDLDSQRILKLGIDILPLLAIELSARDCANDHAPRALWHATVTGAAFEQLLLEAVRLPCEFGDFQMTKGTSAAMTFA
jgi:hypothetical protein